MGFFGNIVNSLKKASRARFQINKDTKSVQFLIDSKDDNYFTLEFDNMTIKNPSDFCVQSSSIIEGSNSTLGSLYLEHIRLLPNCEFRSSPYSAFELLVKKEFNSYDFEYIKSYDSEFFKFSKYNVNNLHQLGIIWFCLNDEELFIFDKKGKLFNDLLKIYNINDESLKIKEDDSLEFVFKNSIVSSNMINDFFGKCD